MTPMTEGQTPMPEPEDHLPPTLERWLRIATYELNEASQARVRAEIIDHFSASVEDRVAQGKPRAAAESAALKALGNPFDEARAYNRSYLTRNDTAFLRLFMNVDPRFGVGGSSKKTWLVLYALSILTAALEIWRAGNWLNNLLYVIAIPLALMAATLALVKILDRRFGTKSLRVRILLFGLILTVAIYSLLIYFSWGLGFNHSPGMNLTGYWLLAFWFRAWPILRKLKTESKLATYGKAERHA